MASTFSQPVSPRRRAISVGLTILVHALIALLLLKLAPPFAPPPSGQGSLSTFDVAPPAAREQRQAPQQRKRAEKRPPPPPRATAPPPPPIPLPRPKTPDASGIIWMDRDQFAKSDITGIRHPEDVGETGADTADSKAPYGPGQGPGGGRLFNAEWVREPTDAELSTFVPSAPPGSWGEIACQTIEANRVDNCRTLGESPLGSRIATGMRRAAWQFLVRPPRLNGKPMIGAWVRIHIEFSERGAKVRR